jgi:hypothetical protein
MVLLGGTGTGVLSGPIGAADVARQFIKLGSHTAFPRRQNSSA